MRLKNKSSSSTVVLVLTFVAFLSSFGQAQHLTDSELQVHIGGESSQQWISLSEDAEFQAASVDPSRNARLLRDVQGRLLGGSISALSSIDAYGTYYDGYSQAWRYLGFYIDCGEQRGGGHHRNRRRELKEGEEEAEGGCNRVLLWAAYIDLDYQGGEIGEYQFYNLENDAWDTTPCNMTGSERCAKMDCHLPDTHFELLGYYKEQNYLQWMEQLFKHQGYCIWDEDEYSFMQTYYESWPEDCTQSKTAVNGNYLYFDLQPTSNGGMSIGLYTDQRCTSQYTGRSPTVNTVLASFYGSSDSPYNIDSYIDDWNKGMDVYRICQPCKAYKLDYGDEGSNGHRALGGSADGNFECDDDAGYNSVNQCMKFATHTKMRAATFQNLMLATQQGFLPGTTVAGVSYGEQIYKEPEDYTFFFHSTIFFLTGVSFFALAAMTHRKTSKTLSEPFIASDGVAT
jgi:hypothetical protein